MPTPTVADVSQDAENKQVRGQPDPFPPEGTDEKIISPAGEGEKPLSEKDRLRATKAVITHGIAEKPDPA